MSLDATKCAIDVWQAGLDSVRSDRVVRENVAIDRTGLVIAGETFSLDSLNRICVVGAGKAGSGMAAGIETSLDSLSLGRDRFFGWINVPEGTERSLPHILLHPARPSGLNEPTESAVDGTQEIVKLVEALQSDDICICLLSGGGSALLPLPTSDITLEQKRQLTRDLSAAGASIQQINTVRKHFSQIKGGGLARRCNAGRLVTLIISDVIGDPLDLIASGPTVTDVTPVSLESVVEQLSRNGATQTLRFIERVLAAPPPSRSESSGIVTNHIIANNERAVHAAARKARELGFQCQVLPPEAPDTTAEELGASLAQRLLKMSKSPNSPACLISGGEPVVKLTAESDRGIGGRNQQVVLSAIFELNRCATSSFDILQAFDFAILSAGTDGEDGPTDSAGAICNRNVMELQKQLNLNVESHLHRNDAYTFFARSEGLYMTGPTATNVCDLRIVTLVPIPAMENA